MSYVINFYSDNMSFRNTCDMEGSLTPEALSYKLEFTIRPNDRMTFKSREEAEKYINAFVVRMHDLANELHKKAIIKEI